MKCSKQIKLISRSANKRLSILINLLTFLKIYTMKTNTKNILSDIKTNISALITDANNNSDCKGFTIVFGNYSINIPPEDQEDFWYDLEEIQDNSNVYFLVNDYNDLCLTTEEYQDEN